MKGSATNFARVPGTAVVIWDAKKKSDNMSADIKAVESYLIRFPGVLTQVKFDKARQTFYAMKQVRGDKFSPPVIYQVSLDEILGQVKAVHDREHDNQNDELGNDDQQAYA